MSPVYFTEKKVIKIEQCLPPNPVYLKWVGVSGTWNYWCFGINQTESLTTSSLGLFEQFIKDLETAKSDSIFIGKDGLPELNLVADNLDKDEIGANPPYLGMKSLLISPQVEMLMNPLTWQSDTLRGALWQTVRVDTGKFKIRETKISLHSVEVTIKLIGLNIQTQ